jgi:hypothetical protein
MMTMKARSFAHGMLRLVPSSGGVSLAFSRFLDAAISMNSGIEDITRSLVFSYDKQERYLFIETWYSLLEESIANCSGRKDVLGDFYGEYVNREHIPVPQHYCDMLPGLLTANMANMRVADYRCRSGRRLLAAARYNRWLRFYGADPDITMVRMTLLNYYMNELAGEVAWYDPLHDEFYAAWGVDLDYRGRPVIRKLEQEQSLIFQKRDGIKPETAKLVFGF